MHCNDVSLNLWNKRWHFLIFEKIEFHEFGLPFIIKHSFHFKYQIQRDASINLSDSSSHTFWNLLPVHISGLLSRLGKPIFSHFFHNNWLRWKDAGNGIPEGQVILFQFRSDKVTNSTSFKPKQSFKRTQRHVSHLYGGGNTDLSF